jgi:hypothetical protein
LGEIESERFLSLLADRREVTDDPRLLLRGCKRIAAMSERTVLGTRRNPTVWGTGSCRCGDELRKELEDGGTGDEVRGRSRCSGVPGRRRFPSLRSRKWAGW